jgi:hypothetical protein
LINDYGFGDQLVDWDLLAAYDVSNDGTVIVGFGSNPADESEGFVVIVPEPGSGMLLLLGIPVVVIYGRWKRWCYWASRMVKPCILSAIGLLLASTSTVHAQLQLSGLQTHNSPLGLKAAPGAGFRFGSIDGQDAGFPAGSTDSTATHCA